MYTGGTSDSGAIDSTLLELLEYLEILNKKWDGIFAQMVSLHLECVQYNIVVDANTNDLCQQENRQPDNHDVLYCRIANSSLAIRM